MKQKKTGEIQYHASAAPQNQNGKSCPTESIIHKRSLTGAHVEEGREDVSYDCARHCSEYAQQSAEDGQRGGDTEGNGHYSNVLENKTKVGELLLREMSVGKKMDAM